MELHRVSIFLYCHVFQIPLRDGSSKFDFVNTHCDSNFKRHLFPSITQNLSTQISVVREMGFQKQWLRRPLRLKNYHVFLNFSLLTFSHERVFWFWFYSYKNVKNHWGVCVEGEECQRYDLGEQFIGQLVLSAFFATWYVRLFNRKVWPVCFFLEIQQREAQIESNEHLWIE